MKTNTVFNIIFFSLLMAACDDGAVFEEKEEKQDRQTTCVRGDDYAYLENRIKRIPCSDNDSLCNQYLSIWKGFFMEQNNLTEEFFNKHIVIYKTEFNDWKQGTSFIVCYEVTIDWAIAYLCDNFPVNINNGSTLFSSLPREKYLTKEDIETTIGKSHTSSITKVLNTESLKFDSMNSAVDFLIDQANVNTLCPNRIYIDKLTGELILECFAVYDFEKNECINATIGLINGESSINDTVCLIIG